MILILYMAECKQFCELKLKREKEMTISHTFFVNFIKNCNELLSDTGFTLVLNSDLIFVLDGKSK